jgi:hypothetical protein
MYDSGGGGRSCKQLSAASSLLEGSRFDVPVIVFNVLQEQSGSVFIPFPVLMFHESGGARGLRPIASYIYATPSHTHTGQ